MIETRWIPDPRGLLEYRVVIPEFLALIAIRIEVKEIYGGAYPWWFRFLPENKYPWWFRSVWKLVGARMECRDARAAAIAAEDDRRLLVYKKCMVDRRLCEFDGLARLVKEASDPV